MKKGFTLLIAILVSAVLLSIALSIFDLTTRQLALSTTAESSQTAIFAADSGIECAMYWDLRYPGQYFPFANQDGSAPTGAYNGDNINCGDGSSVGVSGVSGHTSLNPTVATSTFSFNLTEGAYVEVDIEKYCYGYDANNSSACDSWGSVINSRGYNSGPNYADPSRIERALRETYGAVPVHIGSF